MPKISAPTVAEHRSQVQARLIAAAEEIMRSGEAERLTAGAVSATAGIARNSIYRYVDSIDDLRALVVARHLPEWMAAVSTALERETTPDARVTAWVSANLRQAVESGHAWLIDAVRAAPESPAASASADAAHSDLREPLATAWSELLAGEAEHSRIATAITFGIVETGFGQLEAGVPVTIVEQVCCDAVRGMMKRLSPIT
ncbi:MAG TPA: TetR/AcrR family transcriptional regulator [Humibacter sp.]|jgi:AcrR family transcriptional regulator|nr:TetR/AcrR family transcriptional regulator [Humibacter sp.]